MDIRRQTLPLRLVQDVPRGEQHIGVAEMLVSGVRKSWEMARSRFERSASFSAFTARFFRSLASARASAA